MKATGKFANTLKGFQEMEQWVRKHTDGFVPVVYTMEATGIYHEQLAWHLFSQKQAVSVVLPDKARQYAGPADQIVHLIS